MPPKTFARRANERVSFGLASSWVGLSVSERGYRADCPSCGSCGAYKGYPDHGWCFSCRTRFSVVRLLCAVQDLDPEEAGWLALEKIGESPADDERAWDRALREPDPDRAGLADALRTWCAANIEGWGERQYEPRLSRILAACLGLLPRVRAADDAERWLAKCKQVMRRALGGIT